MSTTLLASKDYALIDLHLHLDGSLPLHTVRELASMQGGFSPGKRPGAYGASSGR